MRDGIYSQRLHADRAWREQLQQFFGRRRRRAERGLGWHALVPGWRWQGVIGSVLPAAAAVLLFSPPYFRSASIATHLMPEVAGRPGTRQLEILRWSSRLRA